MKQFIFLLFLSAPIFSQVVQPNLRSPLNKNNRFEYYSPNAQESVLNFQFTVELNKTTQPTESEVRTAIDYQVTYLFGAFSNQARKGVPKGEHQVQIKRVYRVQTGWRADYAYAGKILVSNGPNTYSFILPYNPYTVWKNSLLANSSNPYPCTDASHAIEKYFWYFFNPTAPGCPLRQGVHYEQIQGTVQFIPNSLDTYPEYERLFVNDELAFHILFGMDNSSQDWNPNSSRDISAQSFRLLRQTLINWGYKSAQWPVQDLQKFFGNLGYYSKMPYVEEFVKQTPKGVVRYRLFFGASTIYDGLGFQKFLSYSMMNSSIMVYAGHSGLGEYLNLDLMQNNAGMKIQANQQRYQIYFFNSCSSYPYYNNQYFNLKKTTLDPQGTKNLDIITNGLSTLFLAIAPSTQALMQAIEVYSLQGKKISYQQIINLANSRNLIGISGDEDNRK